MKKYYAEISQRADLLAVRRWNSRVFCNIKNENVCFNCLCGNHVRVLRHVSSSIYLSGVIDALVHLQWSQASNSIPLNNKNKSRQFKRMPRGIYVNI